MYRIVAQRIVPPLLYCVRRRPEDFICHVYGLQVDFTNTVRGSISEETRCVYSKKRREPAIHLDTGWRIEAECCPPYDAATYSASRSQAWRGESQGPAENKHKSISQK